MWGQEHVVHREEVYSVIWRGNLTEREHVKNPGVDGRIILKWAFKK
jgi:hypothetical protein